MMIEDIKNNIFHGDSAVVLRDFPDNSIDTMITDPPYGLSFMDKKWDYDVPSVGLWKECLRVLKPGATALIFAGSRTQHRMACNVEDAGFILKDCMMWLYGSGFPKAMDISTQIDKDAGIERKVIGTKTSACFSKDESDRHTIGATKVVEIGVTEPATPEAKLWNGWKSHGLKPAYEPILVAIKPNDPTYSKNALKWGVSGLNIAGGRIPLNTGEDLSRDREMTRMDTQDQGWGFKTMSRGNEGRFPTNIILDEDAGKLLDEQSGDSISTKRVCGAGISSLSSFTFGKGGPDADAYTSERGYDDSGGASRFFYCAKASTTERDAGCEHLDKVVSSAKTPGVYDFRVDGHMDGSITAPRFNFHPTVKPLSLMEYLCTLTKTPTGGMVLDPFLGSGTTAMACVNTCRDFVGIELNEAYIKIARARLKPLLEQTKLGAFM